MTYHHYFDRLRIILRDYAKLDEKTQALLWLQNA
jgi:hypothetical protein